MARRQCAWFMTGAFSSGTRTGPASASCRWTWPPIELGSMLPRQQIAQDCRIGRDGPRERVTRCLLTRIPPDRGPKLGVFGRVQGLGGEILDIAPTKEDAGLTVGDGLAGCWNVTRQEKPRTRLRFQVHAGEPLAFGSHDYDVGEVDVVGHPLIVDPPREPESRGDAGRRARGLHGAAPGAVADH